MPILTETQVRSALKRRDISPVYLLVGDDEVGKGPLLTALSALVEAELQPFNVQRLHANERPVDDIVGAARTLPLLGDRRIVIALRSEAFLKPRKKGSAAGSDEGEEAGGEREEEADTTSAATAALERYLAAPSPETCLVLVAADMARNTRLGKQLLKVAAVVEFWGLKQEKDARGRALEQALLAGERYVLGRAREAGLRIGADAVEPLIEHAGTDIGVLRNDVERLITFCAGRREITVDDVRSVVTGAVAVDAWAIPNAIERRDAATALQQLALQLDEGTSPHQILGQLRWLVSERLARSAGGRIVQAVDAVFRTDTALKSSGGDPQVLLERLIVELCGGGGSRPASVRP